MITVSRARSMVLALLAAVGIAAQAAPTAVFDTLGPGNVYQAGTGWAVGSVGNGSNYVTADRFVANAGGALDTATLAFEARSASEPLLTHRDVRVFILADAGGVPGAVVDSAVLTIDVQGANDNPISELATVAFGNDVVLSAGLAYWLAVGTVDAAPDFMVSALFNDQGQRGLHSFSGASFQQPGDWFGPFEELQMAARVVVQSVPEPSALAGAGLLALLVARRLQRRRPGVA